MPDFSFDDSRSPARPAVRPTPPAEHEAARFTRSRASGESVDEGGGLHRLLVESVRDYAIFALDTSGYILSWNAGAEHVKGYTPDEIIGRHFSIFYTDDARSSAFPQYELEMAAKDGRFEDEGWRVRKDGTRFWANVVITALRDATGVLVGYAKVTRDLTERRAAAQRAIEAAQRAAESEAANRAKSEFLAMMSHELRTPLNAISGYADLLAMGLGGELSEQQRQYVQRIRGSQQHLLSIINDLLNFSRMEAGQVTYAIAPVSLCEVIDAVLPMIAPQVAAKGLRIVRDPGDDAVACADRAKVEQILLNLLSNAIKFTPEGGRIELSCGPATAAFVFLRVGDTGIGIPPEMIDAIFEPFVQVGRSLASQHEGTGLGLAISRDLARAMKGELVVSSAPGTGSTFTLRLPSA